MHRRFRWLAFLAVVGSVFSSSIAISAPKDAAAIKLAEDAINNDYLATNFAEAEKKIRNAITMCGASACTAQTRARLHRDLGVVLVAGMNRAEDGRKEFVEALKADPNVALEKDLTTPEIDKAFQAAKGGGATPQTPAAKPPTSASGDMVHAPPPEQAVLTPVPLYVELPDGVDAVKIIARYKAFGTTDWKTLELKKMGKGFGAEVPCQDIGSATGDLSYYVQATDAQGDVVSTSGSRNAPNKVAIKNDIEGEAPHLPDKPAPAQCRDKADCPPGFPGCTPGKKKPTGGNKGWGDACQKDSECGEGLACKNSQCETGEKKDVEEPEPSKPCETNADCDEGDTCNADKLCETPGGGFKKVWLSASFQTDLSYVLSQNNVCGSVHDFQPDNVACYSEDGSPYLGVPDEGVVGAKRGNAIQGGPHLQTFRILVGLDYLVSPNVSVGTRLGYAIGVAPERALSAFHGELRATYWLGKNPFRKKGARPFLSVMAGAAEVDDKFTVPIHECMTASMDADCLGLKPAGMAFPATQNLTAWRKSGGAFAGLSGGVMIPVAKNQGVVAELKIQGLFPNPGIAISPSVGYAFGL